MANEEKKTTIKEIVKTFKLLTPEQKNKLLWLGEGMALAGGVKYEELKKDS